MKISGKTTLFLPSQKKLRISIHADDHLAIEQRLPDSTAIVDFLLRPILAKADYRIESILFERSSTRILNSSYAALERLVLLLKSNPEQEILIQGHTDNVGTVNALKQLSRKRIDSVRRYLVTEGIDPGRISGEAFGGLKPKVQNIDEESRQKNRRVEVILR